MEIDINKKTAVITGASSGIGLEFARLLAADGYDLIVSARRAERLQQLADELGRSHGTAVHIIQMDLVQPNAGEALWQAIRNITPDIDVLVNSAGIGDSGDFAEETPEVIGRMIHLNISTLTSLTRYALPGMVERKHGKILNVASLAGFQPGGPGMAVYYATKSYVLSFSRGIRRELRGTGVSVTACARGRHAPSSRKLPRRSARGCSTGPSQWRRASWRARATRECSAVAAWWCRGC